MSILARRIFLCAIGLIAGLAAWPIAELTLFYQTLFPSYLIFSTVFGGVLGALIGIFFGTTEGIILSVKRRIITGMITGLFIGIIGGVIGFLIGQGLLFILGEYLIHSIFQFNTVGLPVARAIGWAFLGLFVGMIEGVRALSMKKIKIGLLGGFLGGLVGGALLEYFRMTMVDIMLARLMGLLTFGLFLGLFYGFIEARLSFGKIHLLNGQFKGKEFWINQRRLRIGLANKNEIKLSDWYTGVTDVHAELRVKKGEVIIKKLHEEAPVYVNEELISEQQLKLNDVIKIGSAKFIYQF